MVPAPCAARAALLTTYIALKTHRARGRRTTYTLTPRAPRGLAHARTPASIAYDTYRRRTPRRARRGGRRPVEARDHEKFGDKRRLAPCLLDGRTEGNGGPARIEYM